MEVVFLGQKLETFKNCAQQRHCRNTGGRKYNQLHISTNLQFRLDRFAIQIILKSKFPLLTYISTGRTQQQFQPCGKRIMLCASEKTLLIFTTLDNLI